MSASEKLEMWHDHNTEAHGREDRTPGPVRWHLRHHPDCDFQMVDQRMELHYMGIKRIPLHRAAPITQ